MRVCLEQDRSGDSGADLGCQSGRGVGSGVGVKPDGGSGIDTDPRTDDDTAPSVLADYENVRRGSVAVSSAWVDGVEFGGHVSTP